MKAEVKTIQKMHILFTVFIAWLLRKELEEFTSILPVLLVLSDAKEENKALKEEDSNPERVEKAEPFVFGEERRFITEDPIKDGLLWYAYCGNNPMNYVDPNGLMYYNGQSWVSSSADVTIYVNHEVTGADSKGIDGIWRSYGLSDFTLSDMENANSHFDDPHMIHPGEDIVYVPKEFKSMGAIDGPSPTQTEILSNVVDENIRKSISPGNS